MNGLITKLVGAASLAFLAPFFGAGCDEKVELFHDCPLSESILQACEAESTETEITCVVAQHPMCEERVCAEWEGSRSFCTKICDATHACPSGSSCEEYLNFSFCVPDEIKTPPAVTP